MSIVDLAIKSLVIASFGLLAVLLMRRSSAAARHLALALTLFGMCALPIATSLLPAWHVPFLKVFAPQVQHASAPSGPVITAPHLTPKVEVPLTIDPASARLLLWASVATLLAGRVFIRLSRLRRLERRLPMNSDPGLQAIVADFCRERKRHVLFLAGESNEPPMTWGHTRPVLLLPAQANEWPAERLEAVLLHELAHVERGDWLISVASEIICALFWFNPLAWMVRARMEWESEAAADDRVLSLGIPASQYASHLLALVRDMHRYPKSADAALAMARPGRLNGRVAAILESHRRRHRARGSAALGLVAVIGCVVLGVGAATPTLIQRSDTPPVPSRGPVADRSYNDLVQVEPPSTDADVSNIGPVDEVPGPASPSQATVRPPIHREHVASTSAPTTPEPVSLHQAAIRPTSAASADSKARESMSLVGNGANQDSMTSPGQQHQAASRAGDDGGSDVLIDRAELRAQMRQATMEVHKAVEEANREMKKEGISIDLSAITDQALKAAAAGAATGEAAIRASKLDVNKLVAKALKDASRGLADPRPLPEKPSH